MKAIDSFQICLTKANKVRCIRTKDTWPLQNGELGMEKIKQLGIFQKIVLAFLLFIVVLFYIIYALTIKKVGFEYKNSILMQEQENDVTVYSGKVKGEHAKFTVAADKTVEFQYGDKIYGPYIAKENPDVIPREHALSEEMTGVEIYDGEEIFFCGGVMKSGDNYWLFNEEGEFTNINMSWGTIDGVEMDLEGNIIDPMEPSVSNILDLMAGPKLTHKGEWLEWFYGVCVCAITAISILYADELFRWNLAFRIRNVEQAEPSEWEMTSRYIVWTILPILTVALFIVGLQ